MLLAVGLGVPLLTVDQAKPGSQVEVQWYIGTDLTGNTFTGWIDNVVAWKSTHSAAQVQYSVRYLPSATDLTGDDLWHWWPLLNDQASKGTIQQDWLSGETKTLTSQQSSLTWSVCGDPATTDSAFGTTLLPISPVSTEWLQTLQSLETHGFVLTHAFSQLNDELVTADSPVVFTVSLPSFGFLWQVQQSSGDSTQLVREVVAYPGDSVVGSISATVNVSFVPARLPGGGSRDVIDLLNNSMLGESPVPAAEWVLFYTPVTFPYGVLSDNPRIPSDSFTLTATNQLIESQQWSTLHATDASLQPRLTITINTTVGLDEADPILAGLQGTMAAVHRF